MPKDNEVDEKVIVANPESAAVEAVAHRIFSDRSGFWGPWRNGPRPEFADPSARFELAYPQSALDALRGEVAENEGVIRVWRRRCEEAERRVQELEQVIREALDVIKKGRSVGFEHPMTASEIIMGQVLTKESP